MSNDLKKSPLFKSLTTSSDQIKAVRGSLIVSYFETAQSEILNKLKGERNQIVGQIQALEDIYPNSEFEMSVAKANFTQDNAKSNVSLLNALDEELMLKDAVIKIAQARYDKWFKEVQESETPVYKRNQED